MTIRSAVGRVGVLVVLVAAAAVVVGALFGQPLLVGFVDSGSMQPVLSPGDGFVVLPAALAGDVEAGDVVVYDAERLHGGGLVTHRVVDVTPRGFVTRGDANPATDQESGEPPVKRAQVVGVALQVGGRLLSIPHLGAVVGLVGALQARLAALLGTPSLLGAQGLAYLLFAASLGWYAVGAWRDRRGRARARGRTQSRGRSVRPVLLALALLVAAAATVGMVAPSGTQKYPVVSAEFDSPGARVVPTGESETTVHRVGNGGLLPVVVFLEPGSEGIDVSPRELRLGGHSGANATVTLSAPPETGYYRRYLVEHRYLGVLPPALVRSLYRLHPWAPIVAIDALVGGAVYLLGAGLVGTSPIRSREGPSLLRRWYARIVR